jgi:hypothetical protein
MGLRLLVLLAVFAAIPGAIARDVGSPVVQRVHEAGVCWDPDVEFPIPCDDDDD